MKLILLEFCLLLFYNLKNILLKKMYRREMKDAREFYSVSFPRRKKTNIDKGRFYQEIIQFHDTFFSRKIQSPKLQIFLRQ